MKKITVFIFLIAAAFGYAQDPASGPTDPPARATADVVSFYNGIASPTGDDYVNIPGVTFNNFGSAAVITDLALADGNTVKKYTSHNFSGIGGGTYDISLMETLHIDVYFATPPGDFRIKLEDITGGPGATEISVANNPATGVWLSYDIDLTNFPAPNLGSLRWIVPVTTSANATLYFDNIYFYRAPVDPATDANLTGLQVDGAALDGFNAATTSYTVGVSFGAAVPQITGATTSNPNASAVITQASSVPGSATVEVTAEDNTTTKTYTVNFVTEGPSTPAPTPPARPVENVISIYSDAYTNITIEDLDFGLCGNSSGVEEVSIAGNPTLRYFGPGCQGIDFQNNRIDASTFTNIHFDFYTDDAIIGAVFNIKLVDWAGNETEAGSTGLEINFNAGTNPQLVENQWVSVDVDITSLGGMIAGNLTRSDIAQIHITSNLPNAWYDNLYLYKDPGTCDDGIQNQGETGIDCGGPNCAPCTGPPTLAAPTPPARPAADVISIYSDAYTDIAIDNFDFGLCNGGTPNLSVSEVLIADNPTILYSGSGCQGIDFQTNRQNASEFTRFHVDVYTDDANLIGKVFNIKLVDWDGNETDAGATGLEINCNTGTSIPLVSNQWVSIDVNITSAGGMIAGNVKRDDIAQIHITSNLNNAWYDNMYLHKGTVLSTNEFTKDALKVSPNPTNSLWNVKTANQNITNITVFDILGKQVVNINPNAAEAVIDASNLRDGLYLAKISTENGSQTVKLIKN
ncbi:T9SS type A sorting domain-containing protein [Paucihalobacter ruber]|uniref:T9SS type A sorting domain-containing protein n=1 Tax=Paucihalobacter ruber TaxID=2567861 RepID=A0A506PJ44_9FLAO|nr:T9SS type A sorting domain-containing protein [Paucihalobacter ruber]TPV33395.1 T9SS type A sorting domain-containing protein [Paucihalobacter ruber]